DLGAAVANVTQNILIPSFHAFAALLQTVAESINGLFGTKLTAADIGVVLLLAKLVGAFTLLSSVLQRTGGSVGLLRGAFAAVSSVSGVLQVAVQSLGGVFGILRAAV